jgi:hypothetical protein
MKSVSMVRNHTTTVGWQKIAMSLIKTFLALSPGAIV